jgi:hypothetical protein
MISEAEHNLQVGLTQAFINADPTVVVLTPRSRVGDGAGGFRITVGAPKPPATIRLIPVSDAVPEQMSSEGNYASPTFRILAMPDLDMDRYDRFSWKGSTWEITHISLKPDYEKKGDVIRVV